MKQISIIMALLFFMACVVPDSENVMTTKDDNLVENTARKSVSAGGMTFYWSFHDNHLMGEVVAPTDGWVGVGFNPAGGLVGTNLLMAAVVGDELVFEDQFITGVGQHPRVETLGGTAAAIILSGHEEGRSTTVKFKIPVPPADDFHYNLAAGQSVEILLAWSHEDDFGHHSAMRRHVRVTL